MSAAAWLTGLVALLLAGLVATMIRGARLPARPRGDDREPPQAP
ncbi:hypothetical protein [Marilutibacter maris]|nr:hypothetical protein [Lysobacter maris]